MKVKFKKTWSGSYGIFQAGCVCELSGAMLAACPRDAIEEVVVDKEGTESDANKKVRTDKKDSGLSSAAHSGGGGRSGFQGVGKTFRRGACEGN
jgi:hypothetical protein